MSFCSFHHSHFNETDTSLFLSLAGSVSVPGSVSFPVSFSFLGSVSVPGSVSGGRVRRRGRIVVGLR